MPESSGFPGARSAPIPGAHSYLRLVLNWRFPRWKRGEPAPYLRKPWKGRAPCWPLKQGRTQSWAATGGNHLEVPAQPFNKANALTGHRDLHKVGNQLMAPGCPARRVSTGM